jgi:hypothetical protein
VCAGSGPASNPPLKAKVTDVNNKIVVSSLLSLLSLSACDGGAKPVVQAPVVAVAAAGVMAPKTLVGVPAGVVAEAPKYRYSPFVLKVGQGSVFKKISFKDVGYKLKEEEDEARQVYELIAESLAQELASEARLGLAAEVAYDEAILDPNNHVACGSEHLYVDMWHSQTPERWGYSLWSGCGEDDNFAWREIKVEGGEAGDPLELVKPLTRGIVESLATASTKGCYQKSC